MDRAAFVCPGQGAYFPRAAEALWEAVPSTHEVFATIDRVAADLGEEPVRPVLFGSAALTIEELAERSPEALQLGLYGLVVAAFQGLRDRGADPWALIGHSVGEIPALVCAGAFTIAEGAEISWRRVIAARRHAAPGRMLAIGAGEDVAAALVRAVDDPRVALAVHSAPRHSVVSGPADAVTMIGALADRLGRWNTPLPTPYAFHSPQMAAAVEPFRAGIAHIRQKPLQIPVFSTTLGRSLTDDDLFGDMLASGLVRRCDFLGTVRAAHACGVDVFVECGARDTLTRTVRRIVPDVTATRCLTEGVPAESSLAEAAVACTGTAAAPVSAPASGAGTATGAAVPVRSPAEEPAPPKEEVLQEPLAAVDREAVLAEVRALYATALEYPEEVLEEEADLDADLGVDSLKQADLMTRVAKRYGFERRSDEIRMSDHPTLGRIADLVVESRKG